jgi:adenylate cyclase
LPFRPIFAIGRALITEVKDRYRQRKFGLLAGAIIGAIAGILLSLPFGAGLSSLSFETPFVFRKHGPSEALIVYMDEASHELLGQDPLRPWDRALHARLVERLTAAGAKMIVLDIIFSESTNPPPGTDALAAAIKKSNVILASLDIPNSDPQMKGFTTELPAKQLRDAAAGVGLSNLDRHDQLAVNIEATGKIDRIGWRQMFLGSSNAPALAWMAAKVANAPITRNEQNLSRPMWLNYYGPPGAIENFSYATALSPEISPEKFRGKTVFVGAKPISGFPGARLEQFMSPYGYMPGVEVHATAYLNLVRNEALHAVTPLGEAILLAAAGILFGGGMVLLRPQPASAITLLSIIAISVGGIALPLKTHYWFNWAALALIQVPLSFIWSITYNSIKLHIEKLLLEQSLHLHLSPRRAQQIIGHPELLKPGAEKLEIAIMFTDIANFSKITGRMEPGDLFGMMNNYFQVALTCIHKTDGTVIKLIGDAIFAVWNAPFPQQDFCTRGARAALALQESILKLEQDEKFLPLRTRVGLHCGEAYVGNVGSTERFDYTAMGDNINLTSRLEGLNKIVGTQILATRAFQKNLAADIPTRLIGHFRFKGIDRVVQVHELLDAITLSTMTKSSRGNFEDGLFQLQRKQLDEAEAAFTKASFENPQDGPAKFYLMMIPRLRQKGVHLREDWEGEIELDEK